MFWKIFKNDEVIDVLDQLHYVRHQKKHDVVLLCKPEVAEAILSSDGNRQFHVDGLFNFEPDNTIYYVEMINETTYNKLKKQLEMEG